MIKRLRNEPRPLLHTLSHAHHCLGYPGWGLLGKLVAEMTRPLSITKRQAKTLLQAAEEQGGIVEVETAIGTVRLIPQSMATRTGKVDEEPKGYF